MKQLLSFTLLLLAAMACEKPEFSDLQEETPEHGNLTVSIFQLEQTPFSAFTRSEVADACTRLNFAVYDLDGVRQSQVNQKLGDVNFGTASFQLAEGSYQLVAVAHSSDGNPTMTDPSKIKFTNAQGYTDTFLYSDIVTVGEEPQTLPLSLDRIVALCRFVITDDIPQEVARIRFQYKGGSGAFDAFTGLGSVNSTQTLFFDIASSNAQQQFDLYTFLHDTEGTIHLMVTAYDKMDTPLNEREFDVPLKQNIITWVSGPLFNGGNISNSSLSTSTINIDTQWDGEEFIYF